MSLPKEGSRYVDDGIIISVIPDICLTPMGGIMVPIPYTVWCRQADAANLANSVRQTSDLSHAKESLVLRCYGDEPGTGGGIFSGTTGAECTPKTWSETVRAENRNMVRHTDLWWMNHLNTFGILIYIKDMDSYETPTPETIKAQMRLPTDPQTTLNMRPQTAQLAQGAIAVPGAGGAASGLGSAVGLGVITGNALKDKLPEGFREGYNWNSVATVLGLPHVRITGKCPTQLFCWPNPKNPAQLPEYQAQLAMQNAAVNTMNPCSYAMNRAAFMVFGSKIMQSMSKSARNSARNAFINGGGNATGLAAAHKLDMAGGGDPEAIDGLRDASVNSQLGNNWKQMADEVAEYAAVLCANGCPLMRAIFRVC